MLDLRRLRLLSDLARLGTIAAVAQARSYTPSAVSQQLAALEREAGAPLLARTGRRVTLTPAGALLARHADAVLAAVERATAALATVRTGLSGALRIGAFPSAVRTLLPAALVALGRDHPALELRVTELDPVDVPAALRERRLDLAVTHDYDVMPAEPDDAVEAVPLLDEAVYLAAPEAVGPGYRLPDARAADWIVGSPGTACHAVALRVCHAAGYAPRVRDHVDDFAAALALVAAGRGVALVPQLAVGTPPPGVRLIAMAPRRRTRMVYRRGAAEHPAVAAGVAALRAATPMPDETAAPRPTILQ